MTENQVINPYLEQGCISLRHPSKVIEGRVQLTGSKSESNRALMLRELSKGVVDIKNLSAADDTRLMLKALEQLQGAAESDGTCVLNIGPAGTVMRFMTALLSIRPGQYELTGSERMLERPIALLVEALQQLGARISYAGQENYPPLSIQGGFEQAKQEVEIPGHVSSQYLSALLMIAPVLPKGMTLHITGTLTSRPYLQMTLDMLAKAGIHYEWQGQSIQIKPQTFSPCTLEVEPDWSAASYWYSLVALAEEGEIFLPGLKQSSLQGDQAIAHIMERFGVYTTYSDQGVLLQKGPARKDDSILDFTECPDLAQTVIACAAALKENLQVTGLHTLRIKETDRIAALQQELRKFGAVLQEEEPQVFQLDSRGVRSALEGTIDTYEDHRMAMAFAPLALKIDGINIQNPQVVEKSYPDFWVHLQSVGFHVEPEHSRI